MLAFEENNCPNRRLNERVNAALRILATARNSITGERILAQNGLTAMVRVNKLDPDGRKALTGERRLSKAPRRRDRVEEWARYVARTEVILLVIGAVLSTKARFATFNRLPNLSRSEGWHCSWI